MRKKITIWAAVGLMLTQLAAFCGPTTTPEKPVTLLVWGLFDNEEDIRPMFSAYTEQHKNVTINYQKKDIATYEQDLLNALAAGSGPDVFAIHNDWLPRYKDKVVPAPKNLFGSRELSDNFADVISEDMTDKDGNLYGLPLSMDVLALYYNKDLLGSVGIAVPPKTWEEVIAAVKKLTKQDRFGNFLVNGIALGTAGNVNRATDILSLLMLQNGTQVYNPTHNAATLDREIVAPDGSHYNPGVQALEFYTQFANPAKETYTWNNRNNYSLDAFVSGQAAMILTYSYTDATIRQKAPLLNYGIAPMPQIDLSKPKVNYSHYFALSVSKGSPNQTGAWNFLKYATSREGLEKFYAQRKIASPRKDIISSQISDSDIGVFAEGVLTAKTFYKQDNIKAESIFTQMIESVVLRGVAPQQAIATANQQLGNLLRQ